MHPIMTPYAIILCFAFVSSLCMVQAAEGQTLYNDKLLRLLENYAIKRNLELSRPENVGKPPMTPITIMPSDILQGFQESKRWAKTTRLQLYKTNRLYEFLDVFVYNPLRRMGIDIIENSFLRLTCESYRKFKPGFKGQLVSKVKPVSVMTGHLLGALCQFDGSKTIDAKLIRESLNEYLSYEKKLAEIFEHDDAWANNKDIEKIFNYLNAPENKLLVSDVFPYTPEQGKELTDDQYSLLSKQYVTKLLNSGIDRVKWKYF